MAFHFVSSDARLTIDQTRRGLRTAMWLVALFGLLGAVLMNLPRSREVRLTCSRATNECVVTYPHKHRTLPLPTIASVRLGDRTLDLERTTGTRYHLCDAPRAELAPTAETLTTFLRDPSAASTEVGCQGPDGSIPLGGRLAGAFGILIGLMVLGAFLVESHVVVDRAAGTITMRGSSWPLRRWSIERPLASVARVVVRSRYVGRGQRMYLVDVVFTDETVVRAFSPAAYRMSTLEERIAELRRFVEPHAR